MHSYGRIKPVVLLGWTSRLEQQVCCRFAKGSDAIVTTQLSADRSEQHQADFGQLA